MTGLTGCRSKEPANRGCANELHPKDSGGFHGDAGSYAANFMCHVPFAMHKVVLCR